MTVMKKRLFVRWKTLFSVLLCVVLLLASIPASPVSAEDGVLSDGVYLMENMYLVYNYSSYGSFYVRSSSADETASIAVSTNSAGDLDNNIYRYW